MLIRPARPEEYAEIGELAVRVYLAEGYTRADSHYPTVLRDVATRAARAEVAVAAFAGVVLGRGGGALDALAAAEPEELVELVAGLLAGVARG